MHGTLTAGRPGGWVLPVAGILGGAVAVGGGFGLAGSSRASTLLVAVVMLALFLVLLARPEAGVVLGLFLVYTNTPGIAVNYHGAPYFVALVAPLMLAIPLIGSLMNRERIVVSREFLLVLALLVVQIASTLTSDIRTPAPEKLVNFVIEGVVVYFLIVNILRTPEALRRAMWAVIAGGAFVATMTALQNFTGRFDQPFFGYAGLDSGYFRGHSEVARAVGPVADANYYAQILVPLVALSLVLVRRGRDPSERLRAVAAAAICTLAIVFTFSRGASVALVFVLIGLGVLRYLRPMNVIGIVVAIGLAIAFVPGYGERLASFSSVKTGATSASADGDASAKTRATENKAAWLVFRDHPLLGVGPGGYPFFYQEYARKTGGEIHQETSHDSDDPNAGEAPRREAHNLFLGIAADMGLAGLLAFCSLFALTLYQLLLARRKWLRTRPDLEGLATGMFLAVLGYLAAGVFLSLAFERYLWLLLALAGATARVLRQYQPDEDPPPGGARAS